MSAQQTPLYQGRDWLTYRWTVAEVFDALDRMHDLCVSQEWTDAEAFADADLSPLPLLSDFNQDLASYVMTACADTIPPTETFGSTQLKWKFVEIQWWMRTLTSQLSIAAEEESPHFEEITLTLAEIKRLLGSIDG